MNDLEFVLALTRLLLPFLFFGLVGLAFSYRMLWPLMRKLNHSGFDKRATRKLLFAGCSNGTPEIEAEIKRCRLAYAGLLCLFLAFAAFYFGLGAALLLGALVLINMLLARPLEITEDAQ